MSAWETLPTARELADWSDDELEDYLVETYREFAEWHWINARHDRDGYYADEAGSDTCRAFGHVEDDWEDADTHPPSFAGDPLCLATRHGECCVLCEGDCEYGGGEPVALLWSLPGVTA